LILRYTQLAALAALALPAVLSAQTPRRVDARANLPASASDASVRALMGELQQIQVRLQSAHNRVMQDAALRRRQETLMNDVKAAMLRVDPGLDALALQVTRMQAEAARAEQRRDGARLRQLNAELVPIQQRFMRAQQQVMQQPSFQQRGRQLEDELHTRLLQVEPETDRLLVRGRALQERLMRMARQQE
jgi:hypothetical protein